LAQIAGRVDDRDFTRQWLAAETEQEIKEVLLREDHFLSLEIRENLPTAGLIDRPISAIDMPEGSLISMIHRAGNVIIPRGSTVLHQGDRLTIIGYPEGIRRLKKEYLIE
ncbi:MAG: amino acid permease, partial [Calditrichaeota bacterium]|nr:amino acid permease [Calditrichota bacterium]